MNPLRNTRRSRWGKGLFIVILSQPVQWEDVGSGPPHLGLTPRHMEQFTS